MLGTAITDPVTQEAMSCLRVIASDFVAKSVYKTAKELLYEENSQLTKPERVNQLSAVLKRAYVKANKVAPPDKVLRRAALILFNQAHKQTRNPRQQSKNPGSVFKVVVYAQNELAGEIKLVAADVGDVIRKLHPLLLDAIGNAKGYVVAYGITDDSTITMTATKGSGKQRKQIKLIARKVEPKKLDIVQLPRKRITA